MTIPKLATRLILIAASALASACIFAAGASADEGDPIAIRCWLGGGFSIETMWNLRVGMGLTENACKQLPYVVDLDLDKTKVGEFVTLSRLPNEDTATKRVGTGDVNDPNAIVARRNTPPNHEPATDGQSWIARIDASGLKILFLNREQPQTVIDLLENAERIADDFSILTPDVIVANDPGYDEAAVKAIAANLKPRVMIVSSSVEKIGNQTVHHVPHNTLAVSAQADESKITRFVSLTDQPYRLSPELTDLFDKKEAACKSSRETFTHLSVAQLNFRPANGSHTPRWNTEHMMGRELMFFSQIYHVIDPSIPVMDLNPRQMPDDYEMAHPNWTGAEESRQTRRVEAFTRRFAYLLDGMDLDAKARGSKFWTPRALLKQMERHYNEHTANVQKKRKLDGWPMK